MELKSYLVVWKRKDGVNVSITDATSARMAVENIKRGRITTEILGVWEQTEEKWE